MEESGVRHLAGEFPRLLGMFNARVDDKGRVVVPAVHRPRFEPGAVLSFRRDHIATYELAEWDRFLADLVEARRSGRIQPVVFSRTTTRAAQVKLDRAGRLLLPAWMREQLQLTGAVVITGNHEYLGIHPGGYDPTTDMDLALQDASAVEALGI